MYKNLSIYLVSLKISSNEFDEYIHLITLYNIHIHGIRINILNHLQEISRVYRTIRNTKIIQSALWIIAELFEHKKKKYLEMETKRYRFIYRDAVYAKRGKNN